MASAGGGLSRLIRFLEGSVRVREKVQCAARDAFWRGAWVGRISETPSPFGSSLERTSADSSVKWLKVWSTKELVFIKEPLAATPNLRNHFLPTTLGVKLRIGP